MKYEFVINGQPVPKGRPRVYNGHAVTPERTKAAEEMIALAYGGGMFSGPVQVYIRFEMKMPAAWSNRKKGQMYSKPCMAKNGDVDNLQKTVLDALNGRAWVDDSQVTLIAAQKVWGDGRTVMTVEDAV